MATTPQTLDPTADPNFTKEPPDQMEAPKPHGYIPDDATFDQLAQAINPTEPTQTAPTESEENFFETYKTKEDLKAGIDEKTRTIDTLKQNDQRNKAILQAHGIPDLSGSLNQQMKG